ncbi:alpha/beta fold hydrolase [Nocardioides humilatus]|uniref:Alpha/beta fold hydrolase n=1 Tax=Nocardioides humilatus TaxID=2607660 RepID=A0A5B1LNE1_9ACTN|nr:alpha/beta fold hydrolase [Nocardioides humilatus]KAA1421127.1 alpha/beta fold hydrolase [Nocardioides humilatus]
MPIATTPAPGASVFDALSLAATAADEILVGTARDTHDAISRRVHGLLKHPLGSAGAPVEVVHRGIAGAIYGSLGLALRGSSAGFDKLAEAGAGPRLEDGVRGRFVHSAVNGLIGDELLRDRPQLAIPMAVRVDGHDVALNPVDLCSAFPGATDKLVFFLHGLCENESYFNYFRERTGTTYGEALAARGWTPVFLRANTGLPIRHNGVMLAGLIRDAVEAWPVEVERIALVGHSMGGLIMRAATNILESDGPSWTDQVTDVITLCSPHRGAPIAWGIGHGSKFLGLLPETSAFGKILDRRSEGVRDLVDGYVDDIPPLKQARYRLVAATLTKSARHPVGNYVGDYLVRPRSAVGRDRRGAELFPDAEVLHVGNTDHFGVLNHPKVLAALERWLA